MNTAKHVGPASPVTGPHLRGLRALIASTGGGMRPGERGLAWLFFGYFLVLTTVHFAGKSVRQATFIDTLGAENLPWVYLGLAIISYPVLVLYSRLAVRFPAGPLVAATSVVHAVSLVVFFVLFGLERSWVAVLYYIWLGMAFAIAVSQFWSYANQVFDPRQARRIFAFIGAGGLLGAIPGGCLAWAVTELAGARTTLLAAAAMVLLVPVAVSLIERFRPNLRPPSQVEGQARVEEAKGGLEIIRRSRLLLLITVLMAATVVVAQLVSWQFYWYVEQATEGVARAEQLDTRTLIIGQFFILMGVVGFIFQLIFTRRIHRALGISAGMRVLPWTVGLCQVAVVVALVTAPAAVYPLVWVLMLAEGSLRHSVDQATRELLFLPVPADLRVRAKAFIDVFVQRFADGLGALLILPVTFGWMTGSYVGALTALVLGGWLMVTRRVRREYVTEYRRGLKSGIIQPDATIDPNDLRTITTLVQSLGSSDPRTVLNSLELLAGHGQGHLVSPMLLHHGDPAVRRLTLQVLGETGRADLVDLVRRAVSDDDAEVRSGAIQTLAKLEGEQAASLMSDRVDDPDPELRAAAIVSLLGSRDPATAGSADRALARMVEDRDPRVRGEAAKALGEAPDPLAQSVMIQLLHDGDLDVVRSAIRSVRDRVDRDGANPLYAPKLISLMGNRRLKHEAREAVVAFGNGAIQALRLFMRSDDEEIWVRRAVPKTLALIGEQAAADVLQESLDAGDTLLRSKIVEALCFMRGRREEIAFTPSVIKQQVADEAGRYLRCLADLWAISSMHEARLEGPFAVWQRSDRVPTLPQQLLAQRMATLVAVIFGLLELLERPEDVRAARRSLASRRSAMRARALEYLDNSLSGSLRRNVFAVIDDAPPEEKLRRGRLLFGVLMESPEATLERLIRLDPRVDPDSRGIVLAALHAVWAEEVRTLYPVVAKVADEAEDRLVRETAAWVTARAGCVAPGTGTIGKGDTGQMAAMAHIEMMVFLQGVDLFAHCNAEQVLRLAAIARECCFSKGEEIFRTGETPSALYCVVEGRVRLGGGADGGTVVGHRGRFGVLDILSGRPRSCDAIADTETRLLTIEAEDFFDLLSNNIDIVKALFRFVVPAGAEGDEALL